MATRDESRWRAALKILGADTVRATLDFGHVGREIGEPVVGIVDLPPYPSRGFVEAWLEEKAVGWGKVAYWILAFAAVVGVALMVSCIQQVWQSLE